MRMLFEEPMKSDFVDGIGSVFNEITTLWIDPDNRPVRFCSMCFQLSSESTKLASVEEHFFFATHWNYHFPKSFPNMTSLGVGGGVLTNSDFGGWCVKREKHVKNLKHTLNHGLKSWKNIIILEYIDILKVNRLVLINSWPWFIMVWHLIGAGSMEC